MSDRARPESAQLGLPFPHVPRYGAFLPAKSNAAARAWLAQPQEWPQRRLALWGEAGCGKTHLLHLWARAQPAQRQVLDGPDLPAFSPAADIAVDRADQVTKPRALLHLLNSCAEAGCSVVLAGRAAPARWNTGLPDLDSRLRALIAVPIGPPEDTLLEALLRQLLAERQLPVPQELQDWLRLRLPRTAEAMRAIAADLDVASLQAGRPVTRGLIAKLLPRFADNEDLPAASPEGHSLL
jgi:chromosomal replication initiation ATPase DnaA